MRLPRLRFSVRVLMVLVILAGVLVGAWVMRERTRGYRRKAQAFVREEGYWSQVVTMKQGLVAMALENVNAARKGRQLMEELKALGRNEPALEQQAEQMLKESEQHARDIKAEFDQAAAMVAYCAAMKTTYTRAASRPWLPLPADPPPPDREARLSFWLERHDYANALAVLDELIAHEPSSAGHHIHRADILASCPDARYRNGKRALESAARACELDRWEEPRSLDALASAYAESGDFGAAVRWQREALARIPPEMPRSVFADYEERLKLYEQRKPYRGELHVFSELLVP